jgi:hypothetical protein
LGDAFVAGRNRVPRPAAGMTAFLTVRRDMEGYYVKGGVKSRNRRTHRIGNDGVVSMEKEHERYS